jgi:hypothetical protein
LGHRGPLASRSPRTDACVRSLHVSQGRAEKELLAAKLIEAIAKEADQAELDLLFVLFSPAARGGWRRDVLIREVERWAAPYVDAEQLFLGALPAGTGLGDFFGETGHPTADANEVIAEAIATRWAVRPSPDD